MDEDRSESLQGTKAGVGVIHLIVLWMKPGARKVKCFLWSNIPISPQVMSIDEHKSITPVLEGMEA